MPTHHPKLRIAQARSADGASVRELVTWLQRDREVSDADVRAWLKSLLPEYAPRSPVPMRTGSVTVLSQRRR